MRENFKFEMKVDSFLENSNTFINNILAIDQLLYDVNYSLEVFIIPFARDIGWDWKNDHKIYTHDKILSYKEDVESKSTLDIYIEIVDVLSNDYDNVIINILLKSMKVWFI